MTLFQCERKPFHTYARSDWSIELPNLSSIVPVNSRNEEFSQFSIMADERDENFPNFDILSGNDVLLPHNKNSEQNSEKSNTATEEERSSKKRRFADVENEELDSIVENAQAKKTKQATQWAVSVFTGWFQLHG